MSSPIVTYVLEGALEHRDSMGNGEVLRPGEFQRMTAGTGITHSEFNPSRTEPVHLYQIWLFPDRKDHTPSYEQKRFDEAGRRNQLQLVASPDPAEGSLIIHQDARIYLATLDDGRQIGKILQRGDTLGCRSSTERRHSTAPNCKPATARPSATNAR